MDGNQPLVVCSEAQALFLGAQAPSCPAHIHLLFVSDPVLTSLCI